MRKSELTALVESPLLIVKEQIPGLQELISEYPYFTSAQLLLAKAYHQSENLNFEKQLRLSAAYASDRKRLHDLIHQEEKTEDKRQDTENIALPSSNEDQLVNHDVRLNEVETLDEKSNDQHNEITEEEAFLESQIMTAAINSSILQEVGDDEEGIESAAEEITQINEGKSETVSSDFNEQEGHSFSDWIKHFSGKDELTAQANSQNEALKVISEQAKSIQKKAEFFSASKMAKLSVIESDDLVTETLAQVYEAQGKFERAIQAYEKLQLKFPEKRVYFAGRIKAVEEKLKS